MITIQINVAFVCIRQDKMITIQINVAFVCIRQDKMITIQINVAFGCIRQDKMIPIEITVAYAFFLPSKMAEKKNKAKKHLIKNTFYKLHHKVLAWTTQKICSARER